MLSRYKINTFHWHLTENQAWRLESKRYPALNDSAHTTRMPGKYYTQEETRELVDFCRKHFVTLTQINYISSPGTTGRRRGVSSRRGWRPHGPRPGSRASRRRRDAAVRTAPLDGHDGPGRPIPQNRAAGPAQMITPVAMPAAKGSAAGTHFPGVVPARRPVGRARRSAVRKSAVRKPDVRGPAGRGPAARGTAVVTPRARCRRPSWPPPGPRPGSRRP